MWAIIDKRSPAEAIKNLKKEFDVLEFQSHNTSYDEVSGHPDIFIFQSKRSIIIAPNSPKILVDFLESKKIDFIYGIKNVGAELENSTQYNCISSKEYFFHKKAYTDEAVMAENRDKKFINLPQAYTRCSLSVLNNNYFITSDGGIEKALKKNKFNVLMVDPKSIHLPGYPNGFFGGTNGVFKNKFYLNGNLNFHPDGNKIRDYIKKCGLELVELHDGPLYDGGGIFFGE